jgi:hypothetical protein
MGIARACIANCVRERAFANQSGNAFTGQPHVIHQRDEVSTSLRMTTPLLN